MFRCGFPHTSENETDLARSYTVMNLEISGVVPQKEIAGAPLFTRQISDLSPSSFNLFMDKLNAKTPRNNTFHAS
jgi:hypothetical protein